MSFKTVAWALVGALGIGGVLLLNYWASYQPLSTLTYTGFALSLCGLANLVIPFRFLGIRRRAVGAPVLAGGVVLALTALVWPAPIIRVAQSRTRFDQVLPEFHFSERHSTRVHASRAQVMQAIRESTFADLKSLAMLLKIRGAVLRTPVQASAGMLTTRILGGSSRSGFFQDGRENEIAMLWAFDFRKQRPADLHSLQEFAACREQGVIKMGFNFTVEADRDGWCTVTTETRALVLDSPRGMATYWRLIVPGSGLLRLQWLDAIKTRAESAPPTPAALASTREANR